MIQFILFLIAFIAAFLAGGILVYKFYDKIKEFLSKFKK